MYKYSQVDGADEVIEEHLEQIINSVEEEKFDSLLLFGSYAKGEGGFINGNPVNDYDLLLVGGNEKIKNKLESLKLPIKVEVHMVDKVPEKCTQQWYEIKNCGVTLLGDELEFPDWSAYDIPLSDAIESLNRRVISMLVGKYEMMKEEPDYNKIMTQIGKMILALGDIVLIKRGQFNPSYRSRLLMLNEDDIFPFYLLAVYHKVFGIPSFNPDELWDLWNRIRQYFRQYVVDNQIKTDFSDMLCNFDDRIEKDTLESLLKILGGGDWL